MIVCVAVCTSQIIRIEGSQGYSTSYKAKLTVAVTPAADIRKSTLEDIQKNEELVGLYAKISTSSDSQPCSSVRRGLTKRGKNCT